jgi:hypothetical protein
MKNQKSTTAPHNSPQIPKKPVKTRNKRHKTKNQPQKPTNPIKTRKIPAKTEA